MLDLEELSRSAMGMFDRLSMVPRKGTISFDKLYFPRFLRFIKKMKNITMDRRIDRLCERKAKISNFLFPTGLKMQEVQTSLTASV